MTPLLSGEKLGLAYNLVEIGAGSVYATRVRDVRGDGRWATPTSDVYRGTRPRRIVYHHTADGLAHDYAPLQQLQVLELMRGVAPWGLPYNFVVFPGRRGKVWYLNDVDGGWPHTYGGNFDCAIAAWGNYDVEQPSPLLVKRMLRLADALAVMWDRWVPEWQHRDYVATACPGRHLAPLLPSKWRQREA